MFSWSLTMSSFSVQAAAACQVFVNVPHYRSSILCGKCTDSSCKIKTSKVMNYYEHFYPLKTVAYFQPSLLKNCLIYSTANEQVEELKRMIIITNQ